MLFRSDVQSELAPAAVAIAEAAVRATKAAAAAASVGNVLCSEPAATAAIFSAPYDAPRDPHEYRRASDGAKSLGAKGPLHAAAATTTTATAAPTLNGSGIGSQQSGALASAAAGCRA